VCASQVMAWPVRRASDRQARQPAHLRFGLNVIILVRVLPRLLQLLPLRLQAAAARRPKAINGLQQLQSALLLDDAPLLTPPSSVTHGASGWSARSVDLARIGSTSCLPTHTFRRTPNRQNPPPPATIPACLAQTSDVMPRPRPRPPRLACSTCAGIPWSSCGGRAGRDAPPGSTNADSGSTRSSERCETAV
jgi:hypothetical protein